MIPSNECKVSGIADMRDGLDERLENHSFEWSKAFWTRQEIESCIDFWSDTGGGVRKAAEDDGERQLGQQPRTE
jgi:hypothetical protein